MKKTQISHPRIEDQKHYKKIGKLRKAIATHIGRKSADIYIDENHLKHILLRHKSELAKIGFTPETFLNFVLNGFNRIYKGKRDALVLVVWNGVPKVAVIELNLALKKEFYEVLTAFIRTKSMFKKENLLWQKK
ncbi:MAG: hypothetical protein FWD02_00030 [Bacteroidales bacterium]|nr:hypothetical protein [Bacteroidales bacterium]